MTTNTAQASSENVWGQAGAKSATNNSPPAPNQLNATPASTQSNNAPSSTTKQQLEQLHSLREAIFSQDGWGVVSCVYCTLLLKYNVMYITIT